MINEAKILFVPGTLILNPTTKTPPDYGGTIMGSGRKFRVIPNYVYVENFAVEFARAHRIFVVDGGTQVKFLLRQWEAAAINDFFPGASGGNVAIPGGIQNGSELSVRNYLYAADRATDPSAYIKDAIPVIDQDVEALKFTEEEELKVWLTFQTLPSQTNNLQIAPIADLVL